MSKEKTIPITIGVTGHRAVREEDREALYAAVMSELKLLRELYPNSPFVMLNSLAEGADQLCADAAREQEIPIVAVLPMDAELYEKDFSPEGLERFRFHCAHARQVFTAPFTESPDGAPDRHFLFRQAGIYLVTHSHLMLALWDGGEGKDGCGTADVVDFSLHGSFTPSGSVPLRSDSKEAVIHIFTPRGSHTEEPAGTCHILGNRQAVADELKKTDDFNRLAAALPPPRRRLLPEDTADPVLSAMESVYLAASSISTSAAATFRKILAQLAVTSTIVTVAFLLYDEVPPPVYRMQGAGRMPSGPGLSFLCRQRRAGIGAADMDAAGGDRLDQGRAVRALRGKSLRPSSRHSRVLGRGSAQISRGRSQQGRAQRRHKRARGRNGADRERGALCFRAAV